MRQHTRTPSFVTSTFFGLSVLAGCGADADLSDFVDDEEAAVDASIAPGPEELSVESRTVEVVSNSLGTTEDMFIHNGLPYGSVSALQFLQLQPTGRHRVLVQFDSAEIDAAIGTDTLLSATLVLPVHAPARHWSPAGRDIDVHRMTTAWTDQATWTCPDDLDLQNAQADCNPGWSHAPNAVPPYDAVPTASHTVNNGDVDPIELDVTADVLVGQADLGWLIKKSVPHASGRLRLSSSESGNGPQLVLEVEPDDCPDDPNKTEAGVCGCGVPDDETGCMTACPTYTDVIAYMNSVVDGQGVNDCHPELTMTCDGDFIRVTGESDLGTPFFAELPRPALQGTVTGHGSYGTCNGFFGAFAGVASFSPDHYFTCQMIFDQGCAQLPSE